VRNGSRWFHEWALWSKIMAGILGPFGSLGRRDEAAPNQAGIFFVKNVASARTFLGPPITHCFPARTIDWMPHFELRSNGLARHPERAIVLWVVGYAVFARTFVCFKLALEQFVGFKRKDVYPPQISSFGPCCVCFSRHRVRLGS
jgi:hypothetical protein